MPNQMAAKLANQLKTEGIHNRAVLKAIANTPRELFVPVGFKEAAYLNHALPIACGQTISQPYVVAAMTQAIMREQPLKRVLEIGTGSGYQAAVLSQLADEVYTVERIKQLYLTAKQHLTNYQNVFLKHADGMVGWQAHAPYDGIIVTAATEKVPDALCEQLGEGAHLIAPVTINDHQVLQLITRRGQAFEKQSLDAVVFVPLLPGTLG